MGGSSLGAKAIYNFLQHKIKKRFSFFDNLKSRKFKNK
jgi:glucose-6-phosphate isomerase